MGNDVEACTLILGHGEGWRNSDPVICGRAARGAMCGAKYECPEGMTCPVTNGVKGILPDALNDGCCPTTNPAIKPR